MNLVQIFCSALNLNTHLHLPRQDGVYMVGGVGHFAFHANDVPAAGQLTEALHTISQRVVGFLERRGMLDRLDGNSALAPDGLEEDPKQELHSHSPTYRVAVDR